MKEEGGVLWSQGQAVLAVWIFQTSMTTHTSRLGSFARLILDLPRNLPGTHSSRLLLESLKLNNNLKAVKPSSPLMSALNFKVVITISTNRLRLYDVLWEHNVFWGICFQSL